MLHFQPQMHRKHQSTNFYFANSTGQNTGTLQSLKNESPETSQETINDLYPASYNQMSDLSHHSIEQCTNHHHAFWIDFYKHVNRKQAHWDDSNSHDTCVEMVSTTSSEDG